MTVPVAELHAACVAEVIWVDASGALDAVAATPFVLDGQPALAYPYAFSSLAARIGSAREVAIVLSDRRLGGSGWQALAVVGRPALMDDPDGTIFVDVLLKQELRKHPPSRAIADSVILRRENWWYLPRRIVVLSSTGAADVAERHRPLDEAMLGIASDDGLRVASVDIESWSPNLQVSPTPSLTGPSVLIGHDFSPDLERWVSWTATGVLSGGAFDVHTLDGQPEPPSPLTLRERYRRHRDLERACKSNLSA